MIDKIIIGLGNPGRKYQSNRHNLGFMIIDAFREMHQGPKFKKVKNGHWEESKLNLNNQSLLLVRPLAFMNRSGWVIEELLDIHPQINLDNLLILVDDVNLFSAQLKLRSKGSAGGHNGLKDIIDILGENFARLRIGCGPLPPDLDLTDFVLGNMTKEEKNKINQATPLACQAIESWLKYPIATAMNLINQPNDHDQQEHESQAAISNVRSKG